MARKLKLTDEQKEKLRELQTRNYSIDETTRPYSDGIFIVDFDLCPDDQPKMYATKAEAIARAKEIFRLLWEDNEPVSNMEICVYQQVTEVYVEMPEPKES